MNVNIDIPERNIVDALITACEGGSGYWAASSEYPYSSCRTPQWCEAKIHFKTGVRFEDRLADGEEKSYYILTEESLRSGIKLAAQSFPHIFAAIIEGAPDEPTSDAFLQLALLGEIKYS